MKRYTLSIHNLNSFSYNDDFNGEYDTVDELNEVLEELINDSIAEGLYADRKDYLYHNSVHTYDSKYMVSLYRK